MPQEVKRIRQHTAVTRRQHIAMSLPDYSARDLLAANVQQLMDEHADLNTAKKLAAKCRWPASAGPKRRGKPLSERYIRYVLRPDPDDQHSPSLDVVTAIAVAFKTQAWRLLIDDATFRLWMMGKLFSNKEAIPDERVERHLPLPPSEPSSKGKDRNRKAS